MDATLPNEVWAAAFVLILVALSVFVSANGGRDGRPAVWHNMIWAGVMVLYGSNLVDYNEASPAAWLTLMIGPLAFSIGATLATRPRALHLIREEPQQVKIGSLVTRGQVILLLGIFTAGFMVYLRTIDQLFGLSTLWTDPGAIRGAEISYLAAVPLPARLAMYVGGLLFVVVTARGAVDRPLPRVLNWAVIAFLLVAQLALLQRTNLFLGLTWLVAIHLTRPDRAKKGSKRQATGFERVVAVGLIGVVALSVFQYIGGALGKTGVLELQTGRVNPQLAESGLTSPFVYATSGPAGFLALADSDNDQWPPERVSNRSIFGDYNPQTWGASTLSIPLKVVPVTKPFPSPSPFIDAGIQTNIYTTLEPWYRDWRAPGVAVGMVLLGFVATALHRHRFRSTRLFWLQSLVLSTIFLSPFTARQNSTLFVAQILLVLFLTSPAVRRRPPAEPKSRPGARVAAGGRRAG